MNNYLYNIKPITNEPTALIEEANKRFAEMLKVKRTKPVYDSRKLELFTELDSDYDLALKACGFDLIKLICIVDQELAHNILSIFSQAIEMDNFDEVEINFRRLIARKADKKRGIYWQPDNFTNNVINPIEEANRRYAEKLKVRRTKPTYDSRTELLIELDANCDLALKACGFDIIKRICSIDQELAHNILSIFSQAVENDNFDNVEMSFRKLVAKKLDEEKVVYRQR